MKKTYIKINISVFIFSFILGNGLFFNDSVHNPGEVTSNTIPFAIVCTIISIILTRIVINRKRSTNIIDKKEYISKEINKEEEDFYNKYETIRNKEELDQNFSRAVVLWWVNNRIFNSNKVKYPKYFSRQYQIEQPHLIHNQLVEIGYLKESNNEEKTKNLRIADLKEILKNEGLVQTGSKANLIERILLSEMDLSFLDNLIVHTATEKGGSFLEEYSFVIELNKKEYTKMISPYQYINERNKKKYKASFNDIVWACFQDSQTVGFGYQAWSYLGQVAFNSYLFLKEENHVDAVTFLLEAIIISLSGMYYHNLVHEFSNNIVPDLYIDELRNLDLELKSENMNSDEHLLNRFDEAIIRTSFLPFSYFNKIELEDIIFEFRERGKPNFASYKKNEPDSRKFNISYGPNYDY